MPLLPNSPAVGAAESFPPDATSWIPTLSKRINVPYNSSTAPPGLNQALFGPDPWSKSGKYALGWVYFCIILLAFAIAQRLYTLWIDKIRTALYKESRLISPPQESYPFPQTPYDGEPSFEMARVNTDGSENKLYPRNEPYAMSTADREQSTLSSITPLNKLITLFRFIFYRPLALVVVGKRNRPLALPSPAVIVLAIASLVFTILYCFIPRPYVWQTLAFGSPPLAIRAGMLAVALMPWLIALSMKANFITILTGIGHERLNVMHRWLGWLCLILSLVHMIPFYIEQARDPRGFRVFTSYINAPGGIYVFGTGFAALVPLIFLCLHSASWFRHRMYELFVTLHVPVSIVFTAMLFWHCRNYLSSWSYLYATVAIWVLSYLLRLSYLNWSNPWSMSWLIGDEAAVYLMPENAVKVLIATKKKWRPGQYVYLRMPGIAWFENHPFTIASLCSDDFPSEYGQGYRDMSLVFRPFEGFTKKLMNSAIEKGPWHSYRAFIDGPYGGMRRDLWAFDHVILYAGGSGVTALTSHLLDLIKRMRDGKATTRTVQVIWAIKRPETMEWFKEELRICREFAPPDSVECKFYITAAKRQHGTGQVVSAHTPSRPMSGFFHDKVDVAFQGIANKRQSHYSEYSFGRHSALIQDEAAGDEKKEEQLRREGEDQITSLPRPAAFPIRSTVLHPDQRALQPLRSEQEKRRSRGLQVDIQSAQQAAGTPEQWKELGNFDFGFPNTPTEFQKSLMRFAFLPGSVKKRDGWSIEYGRPDIPYMLRQSYEQFGRRTCVFVCGPTGMRVDVATTVADLQMRILTDSSKDELYLHTENYSI